MSSRAATRSSRRGPAATEKENAIPDTSSRSGSASPMDGFASQSQSKPQSIGRKKGGGNASFKGKGKGKGKKDEDEMEVDDEDYEEEEEQEEEEEEEEEDAEEGGGGGGGGRRDLGIPTGEYDPDQDRNEKRKIRMAYRDKIEAVSQMRGQLADVNISDLTGVIKDSDQLFERVKAPPEATLDSKLLLMTSSLAQSKVQSLKMDAYSFDTNDFVSRLYRFMGGKGRVASGLTQTQTQTQGRSQRKGKGRATQGDLDSDEEEEMDEEMMGRKGLLNWDRTGLVAARWTRRAPRMEFINGPLSVVKERKEKRKFAREVIDESQRVKPQQLKEDDIVRSENETTRLTYQIGETLSEVAGTDGIDFLKFIINPESFGQSVENLFYFSFLIRDGHAAIEEEEETGRWITYRTEPANDQDRQEGQSKVQLVLELTEQIWKDAIEAYGIDKPAIPTRKEKRYGASQQTREDEQDRGNEEEEEEEEEDEQSRSKGKKSKPKGRGRGKK